MKNTAIAAASIAISLAFASGAAFFYADAAQKRLAGEVLRFHIIANSDGAFDQRLKMKARDAILEKYGKRLSGMDLAEARTFLADNLDGISRTAARVLLESGADYGASATLSESAFPTKFYGDTALPAGRYEALRVELGAARGENFWCVMFPPMCVADIAKGPAERGAAEKETEKKLKSALLAENYELITRPAAVRFKVVELAENIKLKLRTCVQ
ncbi:MAG: stage II sporulation protein R [Clostridiales bacterium]|jgi:stage II sporulation protein R|nr:stage II sporulation protein R [Clostridiales bacterium]